MVINFPILTQRNPFNRGFKIPNWSSTMENRNPTATNTQPRIDRLNMQINAHYWEHIPKIYFNIMHRHLANAIHAFNFPHSAALCQIPRQCKVFAVMQGIT